MAHVYLEPAPASIFKLHHEPLPTAIPPPTRDFSIAYPFNVSADTFNGTLNVQVPVTISVVYAAAVWSLNRYNKGRKNKPWRISRTKGFFYFVIAHNVALALYSGWTAVAMFKAVRNTLPPLDQHWTAARFTDAFCKLNGPRGIGDAIVYNPSAARWTTLNRGVNLLRGSPDPADVGRLWNEGLGYYGWIFYLSKFYEVVDTLIILAKGKKSSLLQTYHHAGAMFGMWAGIRYMSSPIWMFVQVNSFIHTVMYSYYTVSALGVRVPVAFKRALTTMQILQLVTGVSYALMHLMVSYDVPVETSYILAQKASNALPSVTSSLVAAASSTGASWLKKIALRAAGEEGLAANVGRSAEVPSSQKFISLAGADRTHEEVRYRWDTTRVNCTDTSGEVFAILLNVIYLMPLTYLFVRFFIRSYLRRGGRAESSKTSSATERLRASSTDAVKGVQREVREAMSPAQVSYSDQELSGTTPLSSSAPSTGAATPPTAKANGKFSPDEDVWFGGANGANGAKKPSPHQTPGDSHSPSPSEARRSAEEAIRRAYESAELADRSAADEEADSIISVETTQTMESSTSLLRDEARRYEVPGVDQVLDPKEAEAEQDMQPPSH